MSKLVILSERNILDWLRKQGVYPSEFYTDLDMLKKRAAIFKETRLVIIFSGACKLSRKKVQEFVTSLQNRIDDKHDTGILSIHILSDCVIEGYHEYMYYEDLPTGELDIYAGKDKIGENDEFWTNLEYEDAEHTEVFLRDLHTEVEEKVEDYTRDIESEKDLRKLIKIPRVKFKKIS